MKVNYYYHMTLDGFEIDWNEDIDVNDNSVNYVLISNTDNIKFIDDFRKLYGHTDMALSTDNDVYYNFYLELDLKVRKHTIKVVVNNSEKDDFKEYEFECHISDHPYEEILERTLLKVLKD